MDVTEFVTAMAPELNRPVHPVSWAEWWEKEDGYKAYVEPFGVVTKETSDVASIDDSYGYSDTEKRTMIFKTDRYGEEPRYFRVQRSSDSFYNDYTWEYADVDEVRPKPVQVTSWEAV